MKPELPRLRGVLHAYAFWVALVAVVPLVAAAREGEARLGAAIYGVGLCALLGISATYHRWRGDPRWKALLRRLDHSTIFVFIAATSTPVALLGLHGTLEALVLAAVWGGALGGVVLSLGWVDAPRVLATGCYLAVGWAGLVSLPAMLDRLGPRPVLLLAAGGALYTLGAVAYATQRPDPWPRTFGFHEVFHALVLAAVVVHFIAIAGVVA